MRSLLSIVFLGIFFSPISAAQAQDCVESTNDHHTPSNGWRMVWSDEFDGTELDASKWSHEVDCWGGGNNERQCYVDWPENTHVADGCLVMTARLETVAGPAWPEHMRSNPDIDATEIKEQLFSSARIRTKGKAEWTYGRIEIRAKLPDGQGLWPAIWMLPTDEIYGAWAKSGEIDIVEAVNLGAECKKCKGKRENHIHGTIHYGAEWPNNRYKGNDTVLGVAESGEQKFHIFAVEWTEGRITWFLDGEAYGSISRRSWSPLIGGINGNKNAPFDQPFHLIMNVAVGGNWPESVNEGGVVFDAFPASMLVDWVRVYQCTDDETGKSCRS